MSLRKKQKISPEKVTIREDLFESDTLEAVKNAWFEKDNMGVVSTVGDVEIIRTPFPVCLVRNLLPTHVIKAALAEIPQVHFYEKSNDLYQFKQTMDLANIRDLPDIGILYNIFKSEVHGWVEKTLASGKRLKPDIAATFSCYEYTDHLLCHDDKCEDRHMAFVLYLTQDWSTADGGNLNLFDTDANCDPRAVATSIPALFNTLVLFEVTPTSFHEVSEVLSESKKRLSLNGWFHSPREEEVRPTIERKLDLSLPIASELNLEELILVNYLEFRNQLDIKSMFVTNSEIQLDEFLLPAVWSQVCAELNSAVVEWRNVGPLNLRNYEVAKPETLPPQLSNLWALLQSRTWLRFLKTVSGLDMVPSTNSDTAAWNLGRQPMCRVELQRWTRGSYTLLMDKDPDFHTPGMDVFLRMPMEGAEAPVNEEDAPEAGHVVYIDKHSQDEECLLHLGYKMNSLGMVFRDLETFRFTKYLDSTSAPFYQIQCLYIPWAPPENNPELKHVDEESESDHEEDNMEESFEGDESEISGPDEDFEEAGEEGGNS